MNNLKPISNSPRRAASAFTLIELLVVIGIIGVLAGMMFPLAKAVNRAKARSKARAELTHVQTAIEAYKIKLGHYPPDNPGYPSTNQLYYELVGQPMPAPGIPGVSGIVNVTRSSEQESARAVNFLAALQTRQVGQIAGGARVLICSVPFRMPDGSNVQNPVRYLSTSPVHNQDSCDVWIDIVVDGRTNRFSNWSRESEIVYQPGL